MDSTKNENETKVTNECKETENEKKSIESPQEDKKAANEKKKNEESPKQEADSSDDEDDLANVLADLYMSGSSNLPNNGKVGEEQVLPTSSGMNQVFEEREENPEGDVDEEALIDRLLEELNRCVVGIILEEEIGDM